MGRFKSDYVLEQLEVAADEPSRETLIAFAWALSDATRLDVVHQLAQACGGCHRVWLKWCVGDSHARPFAKGFLEGSAASQERARHSMEPGHGAAASTRPAGALSVPVGG
jgi:hypothetical protein